MAPHPPGAGQYLRSDSGGSDTPMLAEGPAAGPAPGDCPGPGPDGGPGAARGQRRRRCGPLWGTVAVMAILALQIASTTGLFVYFTMAISKLKSQAPGNAEELRCLQVLNQQPEGSSLEKLSSSQGCLKLASTIKTYVATVTENIIRRSAMKEAWRSYFNTSEGQLPPKITGKPSAHLTLRPQSLAQDAGRSQRSGNLSQSCRHAITHWGHGSLLSHVQNMTYRAGRLRIEQPGKYYVYAQIYFRYRSAGRDSGPQLVQCIQWQPAYSPPVLLLKGVGTKCWAPEADFGLHALYQGGLFELKAGDELFVSVSSLAIDSSDTAASYFGAFRLDL
ncbi:tumor necrosis factor ligand superfamily member 10-like isoform X1 [Haemorhous mexicanus]|uniref:tumor necrosis factor ligand superfamily member 10-like isoform X1 n=1 Tax=Haemorhous mexicanus TaxID=30427 RepID=UPI0028BD6DC2|nr:tumor necrosis factor ligand superfamily member 10-like isoform X1 [Haemorhous mexicanus]